MGSTLGTTIVQDNAVELTGPRISDLEVCGTPGYGGANRPYCPTVLAETDPTMGSGNPWYVYQPLVKWITF